jgi:hypothetical protein
MKEKITAFLFLICVAVLTAGTVLNHGENWREEFWRGYRQIIPTGAAVTSDLPGLIAAADAHVNDVILPKENLVDFFGLTQKMLGKRVMQDAGYGAMYKTLDGQLAFSISKTDVKGMAERTIVLAERLRLAGIDFLYVQAPYKIAPTLGYISLLTHDYSNENADEFMDYISADGVSIFDLRQVILKDGVSQKEVFFDTDHHWSIQGGFFAAWKIAEKLNESYGFNIEPWVMDVGNYDYLRYKNFFLGTMGRRTGSLYSGVDDFVLITPKYETDITYYQRNGAHEIVRRGGFAEAVLNRKALQVHAPVTTNRYAAYPGDHEELVLTNDNRQDGKILIIKDSFGLPVYSFLSLGVHEVRALDMRLYSGDVVEYAKKYEPDIVIILYNADGFRDAMFSFEARPDSYDTDTSPFVYKDGAFVYDNSRGEDGDAAGDTG